jgi:hypothetical protein
MPANPVLAAWERLHAQVRSLWIFQRFTEGLRVLLSMGFFGPGMVKLTGNLFTHLGGEGPASALFDALYHTGAYWRFIGLAQVTAAVLLLVPALAPVGAVFFFAVILNIFVITFTLGFAGTWAITGLMLLGALWLILWEYPRWKLMLPGTGDASARPVGYLVGRAERAGYTLAGLGGWLVFSVMRGFIPEPWAAWLAYAGVGLAPLGALVVLVAWGVAFARRKRETGEEARSAA